MTDDQAIIEQAAKVLSDGGIVIYPTDTAFGIGCRFDRRDAVDRLFRIRERPLTQATPVLVSSQDMALSYFVHPDDIVRHLMQQFWPGALTIIARCNNDDWYSPIRGGGDTVGLRMPDHPGTLEMIGRVGVPVLGPSANFHGKKTPYAFGELDPELIKLVDFVVPGVCKTGNVSTVIDTVAHPPKIIRQGAITIPPEMLV